MENRAQPASAGGRRQGGEPADGTPARRINFESLEGEYVRGRCPSQINRDRNEEQLWDTLTRVNPYRPNRTLVSAPSTIMRRVLGRAPNAVRGAWADHHIIRS